MRPPSPVHLRAARQADGSLLCIWIRRSRRGWAWLDGVDAPLGFTAERYRIVLRSADSSVEVETVEPWHLFSASDLQSAGDGLIEISVVQVGDLAVSRPTSITISNQQG
jgi:hypothetical protein